MSGDWFDQIVNFLEVDTAFRSRMKANTHQGIPLRNRFINYDKYFASATTETSMSNDNMTRDQLAVSATEEDILAHRNLGILHYGKSREQARYAYAYAMIKAREDGLKRDADEGKHQFFRNIDISNFDLSEGKCAQSKSSLKEVINGYIVTVFVDKQLEIRSPRVLTYTEAMEDARSLVRRGCHNVSIVHVGSMATWTP